MNTNSSSVKIKWLISLVIPALILLTPTNELYTTDIRTFLVITVMIILILAFSLAPNMIPALALPFLYALANLVPIEVALVPWTVTVVWMVLGSFILANILERIGLLQRLACICIIKTGGSYTGILMGIAGAGVVIALLIPGGSPVAFAALAFSICKAFNLGPSNTATGIMITSATACLLPGMFFMDPGNVGILIAVADTVTPTTVTYADYMLHNIIFLPFCFLVPFVWSKVFKPEIEINGKDYFKKKLDSLGAMKTEEKKAIYVLIILVAFLMTSSLHGIDMAYGFIFAPIVLFLPGLEVGSNEDIQNVNYPFLFFITACMGIGTVANALGVGNLVSSLLTSPIGGFSTNVFLGIVWLISVVVNFLLTPLAAMATLGAPIMQIATDMQIDARPVIYTMFNGLDQILMPYEYALYMICFSYGLIHIKNFIKAFGIKMILNLVYIFVVAVPYWMLIGLL